MTLQPMMGKAGLLEAGAALPAISQGARSKKPYAIKKVGDQHCVHEVTGGKVGAKIGCHDSRKDALEHRRTLQAADQAIEKAEAAAISPHYLQAVLDRARAYLPRDLWQKLHEISRSSSGGRARAAQLRQLAQELETEEGEKTKMTPVEKAEFASVVGAFLEMERVEKAAGTMLPLHVTGGRPAPMDPDDSHPFIPLKQDHQLCAVCGDQAQHDKHMMTTFDPKSKVPGPSMQDKLHGEVQKSEIEIVDEDAALWVEVEKAEGDKPLQGLVYMVNLHPGVQDAHGDQISAAEIEKAAHGWLLRARQFKSQHLQKAEARVVESYIAPVDFKVARPDGSSAAVLRGSWITVAKVDDPSLLSDIVEGRKTGSSIGGSGVRVKGE